MKTLSPEQYGEMREGAEVVAADTHGDKVLHLSDGTYLKLFRIKRLITSARIFPYWRRFCRNAEGLAELGVPTLKVREVYDLPHLKRTAVHYDPLPGDTLRETEQFDADLVAKLGRFIRQLHDKGVYLRSMHLGNVVITPEGELGLIDVADMRIRSGALSTALRLRNFHHLCRYVDDRRAIARFEDSFLEAFDGTLKRRLREMLQPS